MGKKITYLKDDEGKTMTNRKTGHKLRNSRAKILSVGTNNITEQYCSGIEILIQKMLR